MSGILYDDSAGGFWIFLVLTIILGCAAAVATGRAIAQTWRPHWHLPAFMLILAAAVRFLHYALFQERLLSLQFYFVTLALLVIAGEFGYRARRKQQMTSQYRWLFEPAGLTSWRLRSGS